MPDIVIHGASSFIGRNLVRRLVANNTNIVIVARDTSNLSFADDCLNVRIVRYEKSLTELDEIQFKLNSPVFLDFTWHGVFGSERNSADQLVVNIPLVISSVQLAHRLNASHWIGLGSQAEYGNLDLRIHESNECKPTTLYGKSKLICSQLSTELCQTYKMQHSWLRLFSVYGPDDNHEWLIQYLIREMLENKEINVTKGEQAWDYLFVDDISKMFMKLIQANGVGIANLGSGSAIQVKRIVELIKELTQSNSNINFGAIPYRSDQVMLMEADNTKLCTHLDWHPSTRIEDGLKNTIEFIRKGNK